MMENGVYLKIRELWLEFNIYQDKGLSLKEAFINRLKFKNNINVKRFWALKNINLEFNENDKVGIIGLNGAGKSSLLKTICKVYFPTKGEIISQGNIAPLIEIGAGFNQELSGRENIYLNGAVLGLSKKEIKKRIKNIIEFAELNEFIDMPVKYYSTGMYMRLAFVIATEIEPDILLVDEIFAGGDIHFINKAMQRIEKLFNKTKILIVVSHNMEYLTRLCNRIILLDKGKVVKDGDPDNVIKYYIDNYTNNNK